MTEVQPPCNIFNKWYQRNTLLFTKATFPCIASYWFSELLIDVLEYTIKYMVLENHGSLSEPAASHSSPHSFSLLPLSAFIESLPDPVDYINLLERAVDVWPHDSHLNSSQSHLSSPPNLDAQNCCLFTLPLHPKILESSWIYSVLWDNSHSVYQHMTTYYPRKAWHELGFEVHQSVCKSKHVSINANISLSNPDDIAPLQREDQDTICQDSIAINTLWRQALSISWTCWL